MRYATSPRRRSRLAGCTFSGGDREAAGVDHPRRDRPLEVLARQHARCGTAGARDPRPVSLRCRVRGPRPACRSPDAFLAYDPPMRTPSSSTTAAAAIRSLFAACSSSSKSSSPGDADQRHDHHLDRARAPADCRRSTRSPSRSRRSRARSIKSETVAAPNIKGTVYRVHVRVDDRRQQADPGDRAHRRARTSTPPAGGYPVVSWGHGTNGMADKCTPSLSPTARRAARQHAARQGLGDHRQRLPGRGHAGPAPLHRGRQRGAQHDRHRARRAQHARRERERRTTSCGATARAARPRCSRCRSGPRTRPSCT